MMSFFQVSLSLRSIFFVVCIITGVKGATLQIRPNQNIPAGSKTLTLRCSQPMGGNPTIDAIYRIDVRNSEQILGFIDVLGSKEATLGPGLGSPKYSVTGSIETNAYVEVVIQDPDCKEESEYQCIVKTNLQANQEELKNVTVQTNPSSLMLNVVMEKPYYEANETVTLKCSGIVGKPPKSWRWEWSTSGRWSTMSPNNFDIIDIKDGILTPPPSCIYRQETTLTYRVKKDKVDIRCILGGMEEFSKNKTIQLRDSNTGGGGGNPGGSSGDDPVDAGMIAGIVVAVVVIIVIVIVVVVLVLRKKRQGDGKEYDTREGDKRSDHTVPHSKDNEMKPSHRDHYDNDNDIDNDSGYHKNVEGIHYADLELTRTASRRKYPDDISKRSRSNDENATEYASVQIA